MFAADLSYWSHRAEREAVAAAAAPDAQVAAIHAELSRLCIGRVVRGLKQPSRQDAATQS